MYRTYQWHGRIHFAGGLFLGLLLCLAAAAQAAQAAQAVVSDEAVARASAALAPHRDHLMGQPGVTAVGIGRMADGTTVGIHIYMQAGSAVAAAAMPKALNGVPVRVFVGGGPIVAHRDRTANLSTVPSNSNHMGSFALPVPMGVSTGNVNGEFAGTLGYRVHRLGHPDEVGYVTNNHVAAASGPDLCPAALLPATLPDFGTPQCQPGLLDAGGVCVPPEIGALTQVIPLVFGEQFQPTVDTAFVVSNRGCVSNTIEEVGAPNEQPAFPQLSARLLLSGRTSGLIEIEVQTIQASVTVGYETCGAALFVNQTITSPLPPATSASLPGDSGSPVVQKAGDSITPIGLNFAGNGLIGIINPAPLVFHALGVEIDQAPDETPTGTCF
jgi:hypothetical protein